MKKWELVNFSTDMQHHQCKAGNALLKILKFANLETSKAMIASLRCLMATEGPNVLSISRKILFGLFHHTFYKSTDKHGFQMHFYRLTNN